MLVLDGWKALAQHCRQLREAAGLETSELAAAMGVEPQIIRQAESVTQASRMAARRRVLEHFGYQVTEGFILTELDA